MFLCLRAMNVPFAENSVNLKGHKEETFHNAPSTTVL